MFKKIFLWVVVYLISTSLASASCYDLNNTYRQYSSESTRYFDLYLATSYKDTEARNGYYSQYTQYKSLASDAYYEHQSCKSRISDIFDKWYDASTLWRYSESISYFESYLVENGDTSDSNYAIARKNLSYSYKKYADSFFLKDNFREAVNYYLKALAIDPKLQSANYLIAQSYLALNELNNAQNHAQIAYNNATSASDIDWAKKLLNEIQTKWDTVNAKLNSATNDTISYLQYYLKDLNIHTAWNQISNPRQVIVAVIDDGININHPDLTKNIWVAQNNVYGASKIISFQNDWLPDNATAGEHGTMVAGIIGATSGNNEWIAWIAKNVKLMPIRIFDTDGGTKEEFIIKAIDYATENGANIINLSLWWSQFKYSKWMDEVIKKAYDRWIFVVIAGWNGDVLANKQNGVNLDINPISPVCNNKGNNYSFWVFATNREWYRTLWTNYGRCTPFFAPWEEIVSTSVAWYNKELWINYNQLDGTSFSAPIVSWVLALGYNKYGKVPYSVAYEALSKATTNNSKWNPVLDANKYLNNLQAYFDKQNAKKIDWIKSKAKLQFDRYKNQYSRLAKDTQKAKYQSLLTGFQRKSKTLKWDNLTLNNLIIELINTEISKL